MSLQLLVVYGIADFFLVLCMMLFTKRRYSWWVTGVVMTAVYLMLLFLEVFRYEMFCRGYGLRFTMLIGIVFCLWGGFIVSGYRDGRAMFTGFMSGSYAMFGDVAAKILLFMEVPLAVTVVVEVVIHTLLLVLLLHFLLPPYRRLQSISRIEWGMLSILLLMFFIAFYLLYACLKRPDAILFYHLVPLAYLLTIYLLVVLAFQLLGRLNEREVEDREQKILQAGMGALKREVDELHRAERRIAEYNHDSRHFARMLGGMMAEKDYQGVEKTLAEMQSMSVVTSVKHYCANIPLNGMAAYYIRMAEEEKICVATELEKLPEDLGANSWELAMVIGNLLENAIQATAEVEPPEGRQLHIRGRRTGGQVMFEIRNTYAGTIEFDRQSHLPVSGKGSGHGLGMRSVAGFVEKWKGTLDCGVENGWFYVRMLI